MFQMSVLSSGDLVALRKYCRGSDIDFTAVILANFKWNLVEEVVPRWKDFSDAISRTDTDTLNALDLFGKTLSILETEIKSQLADSGLKGHENEIFRKDLVVHVKTVVFGSIPSKLAVGLKSLFQAVFNAYVVCNNGVANMDESCEGCQRDQDACCCEEILKRFRGIMKILNSLDLIDRLVSKESVDIAYSTVESHVRRSVSGSFTESQLDQLMEWLNQCIMGWLQEIYCWTPGAVKQEICSQQRERLAHFLYKSYAGCLIDSMFDVVADWPDSTPAIFDLKKCFDLVPTNLRKDVAESLKKSVSARLLHPGVNTSVILTAYMQAVNSLRLLDPSGVIMDEVCHSIRQYLRQRPDTVRCIVSFLTEKNNLGDGGHGIGDEALLMELGDSEQDTQTNWEEWEPDPVEVSQGNRRGYRRADMMSMLVSVYGSKELFVKEYCQLLSERLLKNINYDADAEKRYLEMLKVRFGESELNQCEVMLRDMKDSDRINSDIRETTETEDYWSKHFPVTAKILSAQFWPSLKEERIRLPESAQGALDKYKTSFESRKAGSRTIEWWPNLGSVEVELEMNQHRVNMLVSPVQAAIISLFQEKESWSFDELCQKLQATHSTLKRRLSWWSSLGILQESPVGNGHWSLCSCLPAQNRLPHQSDTLEEEEEEENDSEASTDGVEALEQYWGYISGLLKNLESLKPERAHTLLSLFTSPGKENPSLETVNRFLKKKVQDQLLVCSGGLYKLPK